MVGKRKRRRRKERSEVWMEYLCVEWVNKKEKGVEGKSRTRTGGCCCWYCC